ncbi:acyl-oxidase [Ceraceosorus bombacis]|uniref:acyl-CoA oxidase n=1 Tax=Ceraceosorus bombacis TaxID=401625 RepID=A0A0P1BC97_9BASI|nr:acyl-oxidase [Ceraceosorus bombacis]
MTTSNAARPHPTSAPAGASSASSTYQPLGESKSGGRVPRVTLPVPIGNVASQTATDMQAARGKAAFDPAKIESILRDGRIDNDSRVKVVQTLDKDELFGDWKKRMAHMNPRWGQRAMDHNILGCYLQTELGHGTNVAGLETLATYEPSTDTFDLHSPTLTSTKWWAGGSGLTATHGIVQAQLIINNKRFGPHLFFVPLRSLKDGKLFNGIAAGDIGPKTYDAFGGLDNGWVRFNHVKLPRDNMLAKHAQVKKGGEYVRPPSDKLSYGGMIFIRSQMIDRTGWMLSRGNTIAMRTGWMLSRGNTIAMRYSLVRRQFRDPDSKDVAEPERSVLSYPSLHRRLIPLLAKSYAYIIAGRRMRTLYEDMAAQLDSGDTSLLADVHVASSSLKAYCTKQALDGIEECRQALGGHGFSAYAGYTSIFPDNAPTVTYEGDNYVLAQQVGRAMLKTAGELDKNAGAKVSNTTSFLGALKNKDAVKFSPPTSPDEWLKPEVYTAVLGLRAARRVADLRADLSTGRRFVDLSWECVEVARSHAEVVVNAWFTEGVSDDSEGFGSDATYWLNKLVVLHALTCVARDITPLVLPAAQGRGLAAYQSGSAILTPESVLHLETAIRDLHTELLPQYGSSLVGKHVAASWKAEIEPLLRTQNKLAEEGPIKGDGSKL